MPTQRDLMTVIQRIVARETVYLRHYIGKVLANDSSVIVGLSGSGMVQVAIYDLGIDTPDIAFWCYPRDKNSLVTPAVGSWVEVYFINGDRNRPVYLGQANEISGQIASNYDGKPTTQIIFEDNQNQMDIKYDEATGKFEIKSPGQIDIGAGSNNLPSARKTDPVKVTIPAGAIGMVAGPYPVTVSAPIDITGTITDGSQKVNVG